jgi:hypothetical protein
MVRITVLIEGITPLIVQRWEPLRLRLLNRTSPCVLVRPIKRKRKATR